MLKYEKFRPKENQSFEDWYKDKNLLKEFYMLPKDLLKVIIYDRFDYFLSNNYEIDYTNIKISKINGNKEILNEIHSEMSRKDDESLYYTFNVNDMTFKKGNKKENQEKVTNEVTDYILYNRRFKNSIIIDNRYETKKELKYGKKDGTVEDNKNYKLIFEYEEYSILFSLLKENFYIEDFEIYVIEDLKISEEELNKKRIDKIFNKSNKNKSILFKDKIK